LFGRRALLCAGLRRGLRRGGGHRGGLGALVVADLLLVVDLVARLVRLTLCGVDRLADRRRHLRRRRDCDGSDEGEGAHDAAHHSPPPGGFGLGRAALAGAPGGVGPGGAAAGGPPAAAAAAAFSAFGDFLPADFTRGAVRTTYVWISNDDASNCLPAGDATLPGARVSWRLSDVTMRLSEPMFVSICPMS